MTDRVQASATLDPSLTSSVAQQGTSLNHVSDSIGHDGVTHDALVSVTQDITPTPTSSVATPVNTGLDHIGSTVLRSSYSGGDGESSQFPMQHSTESLPENTSTLSTTDFSATAIQDDVTSESVTRSLPSDSVSVKPSASVSEVNSGVSSVSVPDSKPGDVSSDFVTSSEYEPDVTSTDSATPFQSQKMSGSDFTQTPIISSTKVVSTGISNKVPISSSSSVEYKATSRELFSTMTPSETVWTSKPALDTKSFQTTPVVPLTPPTVKPTVQTDGDATSLFGAGGPSNMVLFVAVPLCALGILILLIVLIICLRKRKRKKKGSPGRAYVQDLWVNSQPEIALTSQDALAESNGGEALGNRNGIRVKNNSMPDTEVVKPEDLLTDQTAVQDTDDSEDESDEDDNSKIPDDSGGDNDDNDDKSDDEGCTTYEALYDFPAKVETHMSLRRGDLIHVHRKEDTGWWCGSIGNQRGWFPSNYVQAAPQDKCDTENEMEDGGLSGANVSSFMVKKRGAGDDIRHSQLTEQEIQAEPIYCKIQPKSKRKSDPKLQNKVPPKQLPLINRENTPIPIDGETKFVAVYPYTGHFGGELTLEKGDIILGREKDRNGWMHGVNQSTGEEGWLPAVYVDEIKQEDEKPAAPDPAVYNKLEANTQAGSKKDLVGIMHRAVHKFSAEKAGDLSFETGETIAVFQVLESGWWLGCKGDTVGWFPGSYVEMIDQPAQAFTSKLETDNDRKADSPTGGSSETSTDSESKAPRLKPSRKAPPPPTQESKGVTSPPTGSKIPKFRPGRPAPPPPPPPGKHDTAEVEKIGDSHIHITKADVQVDSNSENSFGQESASAHSTPDSKVKPELPKRYIKPTLVTIPRNKINMSETEKSPSLSRPPPPPRPNAPKLGPVRPKLQAPEEHTGESQSEDEIESFFSITPQRHFDTDILKDTTDIEIPDSYTRLSTFGRQNVSPALKPLSSFGAVKPVSPSPEESEKKPTVTMSHLTKPEEEDSSVVSSNSPRQPENEPKDQAESVLDTKMILEDAGEEINQMDNKYSHKNDDFSDIDRNDNFKAVEPTVSVPKLPESPPKKPKPKSKLSPPKQISLPSTKDQVLETNPPENEQEMSPKAISPSVSKIPRLPGAEPVSRIPMTRKDSPSKKPEPHKQKPSEATEENLSLKRDQIGDADNKSSELQFLPTATDSSELSTDKAVDAFSSSKFETEKVLEVSNGSLPVESDDELRPRAESIDRPPVAPKPKAKSTPKVLPKPKVYAKQSPTEEAPQVETPLSDASVSPTVTERETARTPPEQALSAGEEKKSKIPQGSKIAQKSPLMKGKKSQIPASPQLRKKSQEREKSSPGRKASESDGEMAAAPVDLKIKSESPHSGRKGIPRQRASNSESSPSLRNRSNSPHGRSGIPSSVTRQRSNSPASKLPKASGIPGPASKGGKSRKISGDKKTTKSNSEPSTPVGPLTTSSANGETPGVKTPDECTNGEETFTSPKPQRPSKPPRVQKQNSQEGKSPRAGKSLLPVVQKSPTDPGSASPNVKNKCGIPVTKPPRPPAPKSPSVSEDRSQPKRSLYQAVKGYAAQSDGELSFNEGTFIKELSDCDRPGWRVGMLADGTTGIYPAHFLQPSPVTAQSEA